MRNSGGLEQNGDSRCLLNLFYLEVLLSVFGCCFGGSVGLDFSFLWITTVFSSCLQVSWLFSNYTYFCVNPEIFKDFYLTECWIKGQNYSFPRRHWIVMWSCEINTWAALFWVSNQLYIRKLQVKSDLVAHVWRNLANWSNIFFY